jgi:hypothetical protein
MILIYTTREEEKEEEEIYETRCFSRKQNKVSRIIVFVNIVHYYGFILRHSNNCG